MIDIILALIVKLPVFITGIKYGRYLSLPYRLVLLQVVIAIITELAGSYIAIYQHKHNIWLFNIYWLIDFWLLGMAGYMLLRNGMQKRLVPYLLVTATIVWAANIYTQGIFIHPTLALCLISIILVYIYLGVLSGNLFRNGQLWQQPQLWLSISIISFSACTIPFYSLFNHLYRTSPETLGPLFRIIIGLNLIRYPLVAFSLYLYGRQRMKSPKTANDVF